MHFYFDKNKYITKILEGTEFEREFINFYEVAGDFIRAFIDKYIYNGDVLWDDTFYIIFKGFWTTSDLKENKYDFEVIRCEYDEAHDDIIFAIDGFDGYNYIKFLNIVPENQIEDLLIENNDFINKDLELDLNKDLND